MGGLLEEWFKFECERSLRATESGFGVNDLLKEKGRRLTKISATSNSSSVNLSCSVWFLSLDFGSCRFHHCVIFLCKMFIWTELIILFGVVIS